MLWPHGECRIELQLKFPSAPVHSQSSKHTAALLKDRPGSEMHEAVDTWLMCLSIRMSPFVRFRLLDIQ